MEFYNEGGIATFKKGDWAKRKKKNQMKEAKRRYDAGDRSSYVMKKYGNTQKETPYEKKYKNLTKAQKQKNYQKTGSETGFDPYKRSNTIEYRDNEKMDARDRYLANQAYQKQQDVNQFLDKREALREHMAGRVMGGDPTLDKKEFQKKIKGYTDGVLGLNIGAKYADPVWDPVKRQYVRDKLRLGLGSNDYFDYMQGLHNLNPKKMDTINPWGSGATVRKMITKGFGAPKYGIDQLGKGYNWLKENTGEAGQMIDDIDSIPKNILMKMGILTPTDDKLMEINKNLKGDVNETIEEVINPEADIADYVKRRGYIPGETTFTEADEIFNQSEPSGDPDQIDEDIAYDPTERERKIQFIEAATNLDTAGRSPEQIDTLFEIVKRKTGKGISEDIAEDRASGVIDYTQISPTAPSPVLSGDPEETFDTSGLRKQIELNTSDPTVDIFTDNAFMGDDTFPAGGVGGKMTNMENRIFDVGSFPKTRIFGEEYSGPRNWLLNTINKWGNAPSATEQESLDILNSLPDVSGQADGGYLEKYDDGGYANMSTYEKLKAIADSHYG